MATLRHRTLTKMATDPLLRRLAEDAGLLVGEGPAVY